MLLTKAHNQPKFCRNWLKNVGDICDQKFVLPKKLAKIYQNRLRLLPPKIPIMPNFIEIGETTLEKSVTIFFIPFNILAPQGDPLGQIHRSGWWGTPIPL